MTVRTAPVRTEPLTVSVPLRYLREVNRWPLTELARRIEGYGFRVTPDHLSNVELGHKRPSEALLRAWYLALGLDPLLAAPAAPPAPRRRSTTGDASPPGATRSAAA